MDLLILYLGLGCINSVGRSSGVARFASGGEAVDIKQLVYKPDLVFDVRFTREAMPVADHSHHFASL